jgi:hypothetical protein
MDPWMPPGLDLPHWTRAPRERGADRHLDLLLATLADLQHGTVRCAQLLALRVTHRQIQRRVRSGHLHRLYTGVYAVGRRTLSPEGRRMAAFLAGGADARLAGWSGATQRLLLPEAGRRIDLAVPVSRRVLLPGVDVVRVRPIASEVTLANGIPTHTVARLLLDLARRTDDPELLEWAWRQAIFAKTLDIAEVQRVLGDHDGEPGTPALRALCDRRAQLSGTLRNRFELRMLSIFREAGLPEPLCNVPYEVAPGLVLTPDFRVPSLALVVEGDGRDGHEDVEFLRTDDERDAHYRRRGDTIMRFSWWQAKRERGRILERLRDHQARYAAGERSFMARMGL